MRDVVSDVGSDVNSDVDAVVNLISVGIFLIAGVHNRFVVGPISPCSPIGDKDSRLVANDGSRPAQSPELASIWHRVHWPVPDIE